MISPNAASERRALPLHNRKPVGGDSVDLMHTKLSVEAK
jgi:hypothetical protein